MSDGNGAAAGERGMGSRGLSRVFTKGCGRWRGKEPHLYDALELPTCSSIFDLSYSLQSQHKAGIIILILQARKLRLELSVCLSQCIRKAEPGFKPGSQS